MEVLLGALLVCVLAALVIVAVQASNARGAAVAHAHEAQSNAHRAAMAEQHIAVVTQRAVAAEQYAASLARYQAIPDAEAAASEIRGRATQDAQAMIAQAVAGKAQADTGAKAMLEQAAESAQRMVAEARRKADELAADARATVAEAHRLEDTVRALKNVVNGYGDAYILPTSGLLDELAEHFGHTDAGAQLKAARTRTSTMVKNGGSATCDYVEAARRETAIRFVVDAFNGKVDTILADTKEDNHGTLAQKIKDAFALVNQNGAAFRNARIQPEYLSARLDELKWAVVVHQLRLREREEQRAMRERMRDEERAQKEIERALKDAEKEEALLRKALEKARREVAESGDADRARYEAKLLELGEKLRIAEEKGQRAISMAQQTRSGHVYVISNVGSFGEHVYKIGMTRRLEPTDRVRELGDASVPFEFDIHAMIKAEDAPALECSLHKAFVASQVNKVNPRKEFFRVRIEDVRAKLDELGIQAAWTMTAACRQYQETLALERTLARGDGAAQEWRQAQLRTIEQEAATPASLAREEELAEA
jgi:hypothetical protein